jgi:glycerol-3-phosphate acyltransferase PlsY
MAEMSITGFLVILAAYLLGSVPTGHIIVRKIKGIDIRETGSGSTGATNVNRQLGRDWGRAVLVLGALKGFLVAAFVLIFFRFDLWIAGLAIFLVVLGHVYPVFLKFRGGKGVATFLGVLIPILVICLGGFPHPWTYGAIAGVVISWVIVHKIRKQMGLSSLFLMALVILYFGGLTAFTDFSAYFTLTIFITILALFIIYKHRENWQRLLKGQEPKTDLI